MNLIKTNCHNLLKKAMRLDLCERLFQWWEKAFLLTIIVEGIIGRHSGFRKCLGVYLEGASELYNVCPRKPHDKTH